MYTRKSTGCCGCCSAGCLKARRSTDPKIIAKAVSEVVGFIADLLYALITAFLCAAAGLATWLFCNEADFLLLPSVFGTLAASTLMLAARTHPKPGKRLGKQEAEKLLQSSMVASDFDKDVMDVVERELTADEEEAIRQWTAFRRGLTACICCHDEEAVRVLPLPGAHPKRHLLSRCVKGCGECFEAMRYHVARPVFKWVDRVLTPGFVQWLMVLTACLSVLEVYYGSAKTEMARLVALSCAVVQLGDVLSTLRCDGCSRSSSSSGGACGRCLRSIQAYHASVSAFAVTVGDGCNALLLRLVMGFFPSPRPPTKTDSSFFASLSGQLNGLFTRPSSNRCVPGWLSAPWKYVRSALVVLGETIRHSPIKSLAAMASLVLAVDGFNQLAISFAMQGAYLAGIAPSPPPPPMGAAFASALRLWRDDSFDDRYSILLAPLFAICGAIATALSTTDRVRAVLRPDEFSLAKKLEHELSRQWDAQMGRLGDTYKAHVADVLKFPPMDEIIDAAAVKVQKAVRKKTGAAQAEARRFSQDAAKSFDVISASIKSSAGTAGGVAQAQAAQAATKIAAAARGKQTRKQTRAFLPLLFA